jgi:ribosomal protein S18 acetylase RimI-like enzyme
MVKITKASAKHAYSITVLTREYFSYTNFNLEKIAERLKTRGVHYLVALEDGHCLGYVDFEEKSDGAKILGLAVLPEARGKGIGTKLLKAALAKAKKIGKKKAFMLASEDNLGALSLYEKLGFRKIGKLAEKLWGKEILLLEKSLVSKNLLVLPKKS